MRADSHADRAKVVRHRGLKSSFAAVAWRASSQKKPSANPDRVLMPTCASGELQEISGGAVVSAAASNFSRGGRQGGIGVYGHEAGTATCIRQLYIAFPQMRLVRPNLTGCWARRSPSSPSLFCFVFERKSKIVLTRDVCLKEPREYLRPGQVCKGKLPLFADELGAISPAARSAEAPI
jgi:hypothetical protein